MQVNETVLKYQQAKRPPTYQDYLELPNDRNRYEILEGELIMGPAPVTDHQQISIKLSTLLFTFVDEKKLGFVFSAPYDIIFENKNVVQPDIIFVSNKNKKIITEKNIQGPPDLIIEILSPSTAYYDLVDKKEIYEKFSVQEYWIVDPKKQRIEIFELVSGSYQLYQKSEKKGTIKSKIINKFEISLTAVFSE